MAPLPFNNEEFEYWAQPGKKLRVGYILDDAISKCSQAMRTPVLKTVEYLRAEGHEVIPFPSDFIFELGPIYLRLCMMEANIDMKGEALCPCYDPIGRIIPDSLKTPLGKLFDLIGMYKEGIMLPHVNLDKAIPTYEAAVRRQEIVKELA